MRVTTRGAGYTLVELLIVVSIVATFAVVAIPRFSSAHRAAQLREHVRQVQSMVWAARMWAVENDGTAVIAVPPAMDAIELQHETSGARPPVTVDVVRLPETIELTADGLPLRLTADGRSSGATLAFRLGARAESLIVDRVTAAPRVVAATARAGVQP